MYQIAECLIFVQSGQVWRHRLPSYTILSSKHNNQIKGTASEVLQNVVSLQKSKAGMIEFESSNYPVEVL